MSSQFRNIKQITRRLFDEVLNNAYRSFRADSEPARSLQLTQLEQRVLMSASPAVVVADMVDAIVESDALTPDAAMLTESSNSEVNQNNAGIESDLERLKIRLIKLRTNQLVVEQVREWIAKNS